MPLLRTMARGAWVGKGENDHPSPRGSPRATESSRKVLAGLGSSSRSAGVCVCDNSSRKGFAGFARSRIPTTVFFFLSRLKCTTAVSMILIYDSARIPKCFFVFAGFWVSRIFQHANLYRFFGLTAAVAVGVSRNDKRRFERRSRPDDGFPCSRRRFQGLWQVWHGRHTQRKSYVISPGDATVVVVVVFPDVSGMASGVPSDAPALL